MSASQSADLSPKAKPTTSDQSNEQIGSRESSPTTARYLPKQSSSSSSISSRRFNDGAVSRASSTESLLDDISQKARCMFALLDSEGVGYIDRQELAVCCEDLGPEELSDLFAELDRDGDGKISMKDFKEGFRSISRTLAQKNQDRRRSRLLSVGEMESLGISSSRRGGHRVAEERRERGGVQQPGDRVGSCGDATDDGSHERPTVGPRLAESLACLNCQEDVVDLYQYINAECPHLVDHFEGIILDVIQDIHMHKRELERLEKLLIKEKEMHERQIRQLDEEQDYQIKTFESRVRQEEREKLEAAYALQLTQRNAQIEAMEENIKHIQDLAEKQKKSAQQSADSVSVSLRSELTILEDENRRLRSELSEMETQLALVKGELLQMRQEHMHQTKERLRDQSTLSQYVAEQEKLAKQLSLLHQANRDLHDTNDTLRSAIDGHSPRITSAPMNIMISAPNFDTRETRCRKISAPAMNILMEDQLGACDPRLMMTGDSCEIDSPVGDIDSGRSTLRDVAELDSEFDDSVVYRRYPMGHGRSASARPPLRRFHGDPSEGETAKESDMDEMSYRTIATRPNTLNLPESLSGDHRLSDSDSSKTTQRHTGRRNSPHRRHYKSKNSGRSLSSRSRVSNSSTVRHSMATSCDNMDSVGELTVPKVDLCKTPVGQPERMFRIVLAGDAAVGKSSFITRLCKNKFVPNMKTTLGIDFHNKTVEVDGRIFALQLWDTAGQERFRSVATSYFRRADGVLLLYDCTYERSFLNVREWIESVNEAALRAIPIMLVANKTDLRKQVEAEGKRCISYQEGKRLAQEHEGLFIETSAKDGSNTYECVIELARLLKSTEDLEVNHAHVHLMQQTQTREKKDTGCCSF